LKDQNVLVQKQAWRFLMVQTDQKFASDQTCKWADWWAAHQATFRPKSAEQAREQSRDRMWRSWRQSPRARTPTPQSADPPGQ
jgi:hypothetical protein